MKIRDRAAIILAAGQGKRMKSRLAKVLHPLAGKPILSYVIDLATHTHSSRTLVIVGHQAEAVSKVVSEKGAQPILQEKRLGTGDAVRQAKEVLKHFHGSILILNGDTPLLRKETIERLFQAHHANAATVSLLTVHLDQPSGYGRIIRNKGGALSKIVEERDAALGELEIKEINTGVYLCEADFLFKALDQLQPNNEQGEYYLTDIIGIAVSLGEKLVGVEAEPDEVIGINSRVDLAKAEAVMRNRINTRWLAEGVTMIDPLQVRIDADVAIAPDVVLYPGVSLEGHTDIAEGATLYPARIRDSRIGESVLIKDHCLIEESVIESGAIIGPFAHLRPGAVIKSGAKVGNFVEMKKSVLGEGSKVNHLTYIGNTKIGKGVNIGAGTVTCNYDGKKKSETVIENGVFIGSNTELIAPVTIGADALIAAGTTITRNVPAGGLAISRVRQENKAGWTRKKRSGSKT